MAPNLPPDQNSQNDAHPKDDDAQFDKIDGQIQGLKKRMESIEVEFIALLSFFSDLEEPLSDEAPTEPDSPE